MHTHTYTHIHIYIYIYTCYNYALYSICTKISAPGEPGAEAHAGGRRSELAYIYI